MEQWIRIATDYKIVVVPDTGGTRPCIECPQCLGLYYLYFCLYSGIMQYCMSSERGMGPCGVHLSESELAAWSICICVLFLIMS